jgi:hypothetical protein
VEQRREDEEVEEQRCAGLRQEAEASGREGREARQAVGGALEIVKGVDGRREEQEQVVVREKGAAEIPEGGRCC